MNEELLDELRPVFDRMYAVFSKVTTRSVYSPGALMREDECQRLLRVPLRQLMIEDLGQYPSKAITTWGDLTMFKHFLPRLLEVCVCDWPAGDLFSFSVKLGHAKVWAWSDVEIATLHDALMASSVSLVKHKVVCFQANHRSDGEWKSWCLCLLGLGVNMRPWIEFVDALDGQERAQVLLALLVDFNRHPPFARAECWCVCPESDAATAAFRRWLYGDATGVCLAGQLADPALPDRECWVDGLACWQAGNRLVHGRKLATTDANELECKVLALLAAVCKDPDLPLADLSSGVDGQALPVDVIADRIRLARCVPSWDWAVCGGLRVDSFEPWVLEEADTPVGKARQRFAVVCSLLGWLVRPEICEWVAPNCLALRLLDWQFESKDPAMVALIGSLFLPLRDHFQSFGLLFDHAFFTFAAMLVANAAGDHGTVADLAVVLLDDDDRLRQAHWVRWRWHLPSAFLFATAADDALLAGWKQMAGRLTNPLEDENVELVTGALVG